MLIPQRFNGPPASGNGGFTAGTLAGRVAAEVVTVRLRLPPPLDTELAVDSTDGRVRALAGDAVVAEAYPGELPADPVPPVDHATAVRAAERYWGRTDHPFPTCYVCGPKHPSGLHIESGPVRAGLVAAPWTTPADVGLPMVWGALDCPGGWAARIDLHPGVLGTITATVYETPGVGETCVAVGEGRGRDGRKAYAATALYGADGRLLGRAEQVWIAVDPATFNSR